MRIIVLGAWGYLGWPTCMHLAARGHDVLGVDNYAKATWENAIGVKPLRPIPRMSARTRHWHIKTDGMPDIPSHFMNINDPNPDQWQVLDEFKPDAIVHYAEQPSAPYSHIGVTEAVDTQKNNILGTLRLLWWLRDHPDVHLVKLGTMGEYGTPNIDIEEGWIDIEHKGRQDRMLYPKSPASWYHASKVADSVNLEYACRCWGLRATDLNQGVVYGIHTPEMELADSLHTSFHYDAVFGTVLNRFIAQAVTGHPLTVYGNGSQTRGYLNINDTLQCVELALTHPAAAGEFRVLNQFTEQFSVMELANRVSALTGAEIKCINDPRVEKMDHYYNATHTGLLDLGLKPHLLTGEVLESMISEVDQLKFGIDTDQFMPRVTWQ